MADDKIIISIELDDGSVKKGFLKIEDQAKSTGDKLGKDLEKGIGSVSLGKLAAIGAGITAAFKVASGAIGLLGDAIAGASAEVDSINRLNTALQLTGKFSQESSNDLINFSNELQASTKFANDAVLEVSALIQTLGNLDQQGLKGATKAALDLSTALGIDVNSAATLVGKAANGNVEAFKRYGVEIKKGATDAETFANALQTLQSRFGGASEAASQTFSGSLEKLKNVFGDVLENIGFAITQSPALIALFNSLSKILVRAGDAIKNSLGGKDILKPFISGALEAAQVLTSVFGPALELTFQVGERLVSSLVTGLKTVFSGLTFIGSGIEAIINRVFGTNSTTLSDTFNASLQSLNESAFQTAQVLGEPFKTTVTEGALSVMTELKTAVDSTNGSLNDTTIAMSNVANQAAELTPMQLAIQDLNANAGTLGQTFSLVGQGVVDAANKMALEGSAAFKRMGETAIKGLGSAVGNAFSAFGAALARGENALKAFTQAFLQSIGQAAVALGTEFILRGTAYLFVPGLQSLGAPLIAAGAALATFGGVISAVGGGGAPATSGGGGAGQASGEFGVVGELPDTVAPQKPQSQIAVTVQGDVLDSSDTGLRIVDILRQYADKNGDVVTA